MKATDRVFGGGAGAARRFAGIVAGLLGVAAACLAQAPAPPSAPRELVVDVIAQGNRQVPTERVRSLIRTRPGAEFNKDVADEDVRSLYKTGAFANVKVETVSTPQGVVVYYLLREQPSMVQEIIYQGAKHLKPEELDTATGLRKGVPLNPVMNQTARQAILRRYEEENRPLASVDLVEGGNPGDTRVVFNITEGPVPRVHGIDIVGNTFVSEARLKTQIQSSTAILWTFGGKYNAMMVNEDVNKLVEYYRSFGFHDVRVTREVRWTGSDSVKLVFHVHEGQRYRISSVDVHGGHVMNRDEMLSLVSLRPDEIYNKQKSEVDEARIKAAIGFRGHEAAVHERLVWEKNGQVSVHYDIEERPPAVVGEIKIIGNDVTRQNVILRQIPLYPGQTLTYPDLKVAERNLQRLNIFENNPETGVRPTVMVDESGNPDSPVKDIIVNVNETQTGSILFGVGVNSDAGLTGSVVLNERNFDITRFPLTCDEFLSGRAFRGAGQEFRIEAVPGNQLQRYTISWRDPFIFDTPYSLGFSGYYYDRAFNEYQESRLGGRIPVGRQFNRFWSASVTGRVENVGVHNVPWFATEDFQEVVGNNFLASARFGVTRDSRDSYLRPTEGSLVDLSFEQETGAYTFPVFNVEGNKYWTVYQRPDGSGRHVLALRGQMSVEGSNAPVYERFYAGGFRTLRGFEFRGIGPTDVNGFKLGGTFMLLNSLEYQMPIRANDQLYLVGFVDSGTVERRVEITDYRVTAGFGARIVVPMLGPMPIALDFGFPIVKAETDREQLFSFYVGFFH